MSTRVLPADFDGGEADQPVVVFTGSTARRCAEAAGVERAEATRCLRTAAGSGKWRRTQPEATRQLKPPVLVLLRRRRRWLTTGIGQTCVETPGIVQVRQRSGLAVIAMPVS